MAALGLNETDAFPVVIRTGRQQIEASYDYVDEGGRLLYQVVRFHPKDFRQRRPGRNGGWKWNLSSTRRVLYRLPQVEQAAAAGKTIFIVEGEKDVHNLERLGLVATTNAAGAGKWRDEYSHSLKGAHVVIIPDNDDAGRTHAEVVARSLFEKVRSVRVLELPGLEDKGDVSDWIAAGGSAADLKRLAREVPIRKQSEELVALPNTDLGNAERFGREYQGQLLYCHSWRSWLEFDGTRWRRDTTGAVHRAAYRLVRKMQREAADIMDDDVRDWSMKWARRSQSSTKLQAMTALAGSLLPITPEHLDADPMVLNVQNGTLDLRTGKLHPHKQSDLITKLAPVSYDETAGCQRWREHILEVFDGNEDLAAYFKRNIGYSITGDVSEQIITILYGTGANGKGTTVNTVMHILGDYAQATRPELLLAKRATNGPSPGEAALKGARFVTTSESGSGQKFDEATVKRLTGGDRIRARFNHQDEFEFSPTHKLSFLTNHKPVIDGTDYAIWRRIHVVPFTRTFTEQTREKDLENKLRAESSGILNWMLEGCLSWKQDGLRPPTAVQDATEDYRSEMDVLAVFLDDCCVTDVPEMQVSVGRIYSQYTAWCERTGEKAESKRGFGLRMRERGFEPGRDRDERYYRGIGLRSSHQASLGTD